MSGPLNTLVGCRVREHRERLGLTLKKLSRKMKISLPFLCKLERGDRIWTARLMQAAAKQLGVEVEALCR